MFPLVSCASSFTVSPGVAGLRRLLAKETKMFFLGYGSSHPPSSLPHQLCLCPRSLVQVAGVVLMLCVT